MGSGIYSVASIKHVSQKCGALEMYAGRTLDSGKGTGQGRRSLPMGLFADSLLIGWAVEAGLGGKNIGSYAVLRTEPLGCLPGIPIWPA